MKALYSTALVTGATSGIGLSVVNRLLEYGIHVYAFGRNFDTAFSEEARSAYPLTLVPCDLEDFKSITTALNSINKPIDLLLHCAGVVHSDYAETVHGFERMYQVNYLSNIFITEQLDTKLSSQATIAFVNSEEHKRGSVDTIDPFMKKKYRPRLMYQNTKLLQLLYAAYLDSLLDFESNQRVIAIHPGTVNSGFGGRNLTGLKRWWWELYGTLREGISPAEAGDIIMNILQYDRDTLSLYYKESMKAEPSPKTKDIALIYKVYTFSLELINSRL